MTNFVHRANAAIENVEIPRFRIEQAFQQIRETPGNIQSVTGSMARRHCVEIRDGHFEHIP